jgi:hypothetical protein
MHNVHPGFSEKLIWVDTPVSNGSKIKAILRGELNQAVAIMVHGRPGLPVAYANSIT